YVGLPLKTVRKLQLVQNAAARVVAGACRFDSVGPLLRRLHWLPVRFRAQFKVLVLTFKALNGSGPGYLRDRLLPYNPTRTLRSSGGALLTVPPLTELLLDSQVAAVARGAFAQLRLVRQLRPYLDRADLATVTHALVTSRLDYCNALYVGLPLKTVRKLQLVQNAAARVVAGASRVTSLDQIYSDPVPSDTGPDVLGSCQRRPRGRLRPVFGGTGVSRNVIRSDLQ
nr:hypothetical protein [Tanacetum cinerariifolium]